MTPRKMKKIPSRIDKDFRTMREEELEVGVVELEEVELVGAVGVAIFWCGNCEEIARVRSEVES